MTNNALPNEVLSLKVEIELVKDEYEDICYYANKENLSFQEALKHIIHRGIDIPIRKNPNPDLDKILSNLEEVISDIEDDENEW